MSEINKINTLERTAFFAGSFNPFTPGHADIVERGLRLFDRVVIGIGINDAKPDSADGAASRLETIRVRYAAEPRVEVLIYTDLTVDAARRVGACCLLRGCRSAADFDYERNIADANRLLAPELDTVILPARPELACISSTLLRDLVRHGRSLPADFAE